MWNPAQAFFVVRHGLGSEEKLTTKYKVVDEICKYMEGDFPGLGRVRSETPNCIHDANCLDMFPIGHAEKATLAWVSIMDYQTPLFRKGCCHYIEFCPSIRYGVNLETVDVTLYHLNSLRPFPWARKGILCSYFRPRGARLFILRAFDFVHRGTLQCFVLETAVFVRFALPGP